MTLKERAMKAKTLSEVMDGRTKLETKDVVGQELTVIDVDVIHPAEGRDYCVVVFDEYPDKFLFGGAVLTSIIQNLIHTCGDSRDQFLAELNDEGGLKIRMVTKKSKNVDPGTRMPLQYTDVEII